LTPTASPLD